VLGFAAEVAFVGGAPPLEGEVAFALIGGEIGRHIAEGADDGSGGFEDADGVARPIEGDLVVARRGQGEGIGFPADDRAGSGGLRAGEDEG